MVSCSSY